MDLVDSYFGKTNRLTKNKDGGIIQTMMTVKHISQKHLCRAQVGGFMPSSWYAISNLSLDRTPESSGSVEAKS